MRNRPSEQGLYQARSESESIELRQRIQVHNKEVVKQAIPELLAKPVPFGSTKGESVPLEELWINQPEASGSPHRYQLLLRVGSPQEGPNALTFRLSIQDKQQGKLCQIDRFFVRDMNNRGVRISGSLSTELGFEGNGLGLALANVEAEVLANVATALRAQAVSPADAGPFYLIVRDVAQPKSAELGLEQIAGAPQRWGWTTKIYSQAYPQLSRIASQVESSLGFLPHTFHPDTDLLVPVLPAEPV